MDSNVGRFSDPRFAPMIVRNVSPYRILEKLGDGDIGMLMSKPATSYDSKCEPAASEKDT